MLEFLVKAAPSLLATLLLALINLLTARGRWPKGPRLFIVTAIFAVFFLASVFFAVAAAVIAWEWPVLFLWLFPAAFAVWWFFLFRKIRKQ